MFNGSYEFLKYFSQDHFSILDLEFQKKENNIYSIYLNKINNNGKKMLPMVFCEIIVFDNIFEIKYSVSLSLCISSITLMLMNIITLIGFRILKTNFLIFIGYVIIFILAFSIGVLLIIYETKKDIYNIDIIIETYNK
jgi:hypothetical protein